MEETGILHTEKITKRYKDVENEIIRSLTELLLLSRIGSDDYSTRGLTFTEDFSIKELTKKQNPKKSNESNPSTIKREVLYKRTEEVRNHILKLLNEQVEDEEIRQKYIKGVNEFFYRYLHGNNVRNLLMCKHKSPLFFKYLIQTNRIPNESEKSIGEKNIRQQLAKILVNRFGDEAFTVEIKQTKDQPPEGRNNYLKNTDGTYITVGDGNYILEQINLSDKSLDYIFKIFCIANEVRKSWGYRIDQVFHDNDFPRIGQNKKSKEEYYISVLGYLLNCQKKLYYGKRGKRGQRERSKKTTKYADVLRALTDNQLGIHNIETLGNEIPEFTRDTTTKDLYIKGEKLLEDIIKEKYKKFRLNGRLKHIQSCVGKIIGGKRLNDIIGFRLSMNAISYMNYEDIKQISLNFLTGINEKLTNMPTIKIKDITIDNKGVLTKEQIKDICSSFNEIINQAHIKKMPESPYVDMITWKKRMIENYGDIIENDPEKLDIAQAFYKRILTGKSRGQNGEYKDFKFNITFEIKDENNKTIGEKTMEIQFDDIRNLIGIENHNTRDFEREINRNSRLSFSQSLEQVRKSYEIHLKNQRDELDDYCSELNLTTEIARTSLFEINFGNGLIKNIEDFTDRDPNNDKDLDETIIETINYFLSNKFIFCFDPYINESQKNLIKFNLQANINGKDRNPATYARLITVDNLHNYKLMKNLHICTIGELATQQHSCLQKDRNVEVGIYVEEKNKIGWISTGELIQYINLGKKKDEEFEA